MCRARCESTSRWSLRLRPSLANGYADTSITRALWTARGCVIAALGTGDKLSAQENAAYGLEERSPNERRAMLRATHEQLASTMPVWFGAGASATNELARSLGAPLNLWDAPIERVQSECLIGPTTWAGPAPDDVAGHLDALAYAGVTWAVFSPDTALGPLENWQSTNEVSRFS